MVLKYENDFERHQMIFRKARGKITLDDLIDTMQSRNFLLGFEGMVFVWSFRPFLERYDDYEVFETQGDAVALQYVEDEGRCPICSSKRYWQYCPKCGEKLTINEEE